MQRNVLPNIPLTVRKQMDEVVQLIELEGNDLFRSYDRLHYEWQGVSTC